MNSNRVLRFQIFSIFFEIVIGTLLHFTYEWSGNNAFVGAFSSVNESTWEHLKLTFFPMFITACIGFFIFKDNKKDYIPYFFCSKAIGILAAISFIVIFFYTYTGILGRNIAIIDIFSFIIAVILGAFVCYWRIVSNKKCNNPFALVLLVILLFAFVSFTYSPPKIQLFQDPNTGLFGTDEKQKDCC